jgi:hypothetical protein
MSRLGRMVVVTRRPTAVTPWLGPGAAFVLMGAAMIIPYVFGWNVHVFSYPPLHADWDPRLGPGTIPAIVVGTLGIRYAGRFARTLPWARLMVTTFLVGVAWLVSLATVDGWAGIGVILDTKYEYLGKARSVTDVSATLHEYVARIPYGHPDNWPVHIAGHPPGALLFFVLLVALGLGSGLAAGWVVLLLAATTPVAVLMTMRRLGAEQAGRQVAPLLVLGPAAIWMAVSADAMFAAVAAWGLCCLAFATTSNGRALICWGALAGLLLGYCVMLSYGLPMLGLLALSILWLAHDWRPFPWTAGAAILVVLAFAASGFSWWEAYPVLRERYWDGVASRRPTSYWVWGDLAALCFSAGPILGAGLAELANRVLNRWQGIGLSSARVPVILSSAAVATVLAADLSGMSKAEVERIWLPFVPWLLVACALLPRRWQRPALALQVVFALVVQHVLFTGW